jgi:hypothetical protein
VTYAHSGVFEELTSSYKLYHMGYEVYTIPATPPDGKIRKHSLLAVLLYLTCLALIGLVFAIGCFILFISGLILDFLAFLGLMGVALSTLAWGRVTRVEGPKFISRILGYFKNPVWK